MLRRTNVLPVAPSLKTEATFNKIVVGGIEVVIPLDVDLGAFPNSQDALRLRGNSGSYSCELLSSDPGVVRLGQKKGQEKWKLSPLFLFRFMCVPPGMYCVDVRIGYEWYTVLEGLNVSEAGLFLGAGTTEEFRWAEGKVTESELLDQLEADKKNRGLIEFSFCARRLARVRVACDGDHVREVGNGIEEADPWLRHLYVLWAAPKVPQGERLSAPGFSLFQTDEKGYLSILGNYGEDDFNPSGTDLSLPLFKGTKYLFYFSRFPCADDPDWGDIHPNSFPKKILKQLKSEEFTQPGGEFLQKCEKTFGVKPFDLSVIDFSKNASDSRKGRSLSEAVIMIPEDSNYYIPKGHDLFNGWMLFKGMPGGLFPHAYRDKKEEEITQCPKVEKEVRKLQYQLGAFRYPIGNQWCPYLPSPSARLPQGDKTVTGNVPTVSKGYLFSNEGIFDVSTRNGVLAFQRDAFFDKGIKLSLKHQEPLRSNQKTLLEKDSSDPVISKGYGTLYNYTIRVMKEIKKSVKYLNSEDTTKYPVCDKFSEISEGELLDKKIYCPTLVDCATGDKIKEWLNAGKRKPGTILINIEKPRDGNFIPYSHWVRADLAKTMLDIEDELINKSGFIQGFRNVGILRDVRQDVGGAPEGRIANSIHKSGLAFDLLMDDYRFGFQDYPIHFVREKSGWIVYGEVAVEKKMKDVGYLKSIQAWKYDFFSETGGKSEEIKFDGKCFLNITEILKKHGLVPIDAHKIGWMAKKEEIITITNNKEFKKFIGVLSRIYDKDLEKNLTRRREWISYWDTISHRKIGINMFSVSVADFISSYQYLDTWARIFSDFKPNPTVTVKPAKMKNSDIIFKKLKSNFTGRKVRIDVKGKWYVNPDNVGDGKEINRISPMEDEEIYDTYHQCLFLEVGRADLTIDLLTGLPNCEYELTPLLPQAPWKSMATDAPPPPDEIPLITNSTIVFELVPGRPIGMEWWHFQFNEGIKERIEKKGKGIRYGDLLNYIGWEDDGLLGQEEKPVFGEGGVGYTQVALNDPAG